MISTFAKLLLVLTSFSPVLLTTAFADYINGGFNSIQLILLLVVFVLVYICYGILKYASKELEILNFEITSVKTADIELVGYVIAYLLPFVTPAELNYSVLAFILFLLLLIIWGTNSYHFNPLLSLIGFNFYEVTTKGAITFLLITKKDIRTTKDIHKVVQITNYIVLDPGEENAKQ